MSGFHNMRMRGRHRLEGGRRNSPGVVVLVVASALFIASIGLTIAIAFNLEARIAAIETVLGIDR